jgi:hypothetical protein
MITRLLAHAPEPQILLFFVFAVVVASVLISMKLRQRAFVRTCERVAEELGGRYEPPALFEIPVIAFRIEGRHATIAFPDGRTPSTSVSVGLGIPSPGTLKVIEEGFGQKFLKLFGAQDLPVGDASFNSEYVVKAAPESLATKIFSPERRLQAMGSVRRLRGMLSPTIDLTEGELKVEVQKRLQDADALLALAQTARDFVGYLLHLEPEIGIVWVDGLRMTGGLCPVCATGLKEPVVRCDDCGIPHHEECWTYLGKCSIYACEGDRPRRRAA